MLISEMNMESILLVTNFRAVDGGWSVRSRARVGRQICATQPAAFLFSTVCRRPLALFSESDPVGAGRHCNLLLLHYTFLCV